MYDNKFKSEILNLFFSLSFLFVLFLFNENIDDNNDEIKIEEIFFKKIQLFK